RLIHTALEHRGRFHSDDAVRSLSKAARDVSQNPKRRAKKSLAVEVRSTTLSMPSFVARWRRFSVKREPIPQPWYSGATAADLNSAVSPCRSIPIVGISRDS